MLISAVSIYFPLFYSLKTLLATLKLLLNAGANLRSYSPNLEAACCLVDRAEYNS